MSKRIDCPKCGEPMDVPAYPGDGVYTSHQCLDSGYAVKRVVDKEDDEQ